MSQKEEKAGSGDNQELHAAEKAAKHLMDAAVELSQAKMTDSAKLVRNLAQGLKRSIEEQREEERRQAARHLLRATDDRLNGKTAVVAGEPGVTENPGIGC